MTTPAQLPRPTTPRLRAILADELQSAVGLLLGSLPTWQRQSVQMASRAAGLDLANASSLLDGISDRSLAVLASHLVNRLMSAMDAADSDERYDDAELSVAIRELNRALGR